MASSNLQRQGLDDSERLSKDLNFQQRIQFTMINTKHVKNDGQFVKEKIELGITFLVYISAGLSASYFRED